MTLAEAIEQTRQMRLDWQCPKCGSRHFGSTLDGEPLRPVARHCHDEYERGCKWSGKPPEVEPKEAILAAMEQAKARLASAETVVEKLREARDAANAFDDAFEARWPDECEAAHERKEAAGLALDTALAQHDASKGGAG